MAIQLIKSAFYHEMETRAKLCDFLSRPEQLSIGKYCREFEEKFAKWQERKYCVFVNSGSSANLILLQSLLNTGRLQKGDEVGFSSLTWATNPMPLMQLGYTPVPIDIELNTLNVSLESFKRSIEGKNIKALFITNVLGFCDNIDAIAEYCISQNILLLEDNCESMGTVYKGKKLGNYGLASTFSTYIGHHMSTIEWGMVCTDDRDLYINLIMTRAHGWDRNLPADIQEEIRAKYGVGGFYAKYAFYTLGYNVRPNEVNGFIGSDQMQYIDEIVTIREANFQKFVEKVNSNPDFYPIQHDHIEKVSNFAIPVVCKSLEILEKYKLRFETEQVEIRPIISGDITEHIFWKEAYGELNKKTTAQLVHSQGFYFGNSPEYTEEEIQILLNLLAI